MQSGEAITSEDIDEVGQCPVYGGNGVRGFTGTHTHDGEFVLIGRQGAHCGNVRLVAGRFWASEHAVVTEVASQHSAAWLRYVLHALDLNQYSVSAAQPGLAVERIRSLAIPVPPPDLQRRIAHFLDRKTAAIDEIIRKKERLIRILQEKRQALITEAVTKGLRSAVGPHRLERLGRVIREVQRLVAVVDDQQYIEIGVRSHGRGIFHKEPVLGWQLEEKKVFWISPGDLVFNIVFAWERAVAVATDAEEGLIGSHRFPTYRPIGENDVRYIRYFLLSDVGRLLLDQNSPGAAGRNRTLDRRALLKEKVSIPEPATQKTLADILDRKTRAIELALETITKSIDTIREHRQALITAAVTGQLEVA